MKIIFIILVLTQYLNAELKNTYFNNGNLRKTCEYKNGKLDGLCTSYYLNGNLQEETSYVQYSKSGLNTKYYENGNIECKTKWKDDRWYEDICYYKNGKYRTYYTSKYWKRFDKNGQLREYIPKKERKIHGNLLKYSEKGQIVGTIPYVNGKKHGIEKICSKFLHMKITDYKSCIETPYLRGKRNGLSKSYEYDKTVEEILYKDNIAISGFIYKNNKKLKLNNAKIHNINNWIKNHPNH